MTTRVRRAAAAKPKIAVPQDAIADFCRRHAIGKLALFGWVLRDDLPTSSTVDLKAVTKKRLFGRTPYCLATSAPLSLRIR